MPSRFQSAFRLLKVAAHTTKWIRGDLHIEGTVTYIGGRKARRLFRKTGVGWLDSKDPDVLHQAESVVLDNGEVLKEPPPKHYFVHPNGEVEEVAQPWWLEGVP